jgi:hypothetical protein
VEDGGGSAEWEGEGTFWIRMLMGCEIVSDFGKHEKTTLGYPKERNAQASIVRK